jgi:hypothetical protein
VTRITVTARQRRAVSEIHGRFLYLPQVEFDRVRPAKDFTTQAIATYTDAICQSKEECPEGDALYAPPSASELVVLSSRLVQGTTLPPATDRLALRFDFPLADVFVKASGKLGVILTLSKRHDVAPRHIDGCRAALVELSSDGTAVDVSPPSQEAVDVDQLTDVTDRFFGWDETAMTATVPASR